MASGLRSDSRVHSSFFFWMGRRPPVALDVLKMKSVKWWKLKNNEIIKSYPRSYLRVCLLAHVALLKWRHSGWNLGGWTGVAVVCPCNCGWLDGWVSGHGNPPTTHTHTHTARDRMSRFNPAIYFVPQCSFMFNVLSFRIWLEAAFVFLISCCFRLFLLWIVWPACYWAHAVPKSPGFAGILTLSARCRPRYGCIKTL